MGSEWADNKIKAEGAKALAAALTPTTDGSPYNTSLTSLNLIGNTVGPEGAKALAHALKPNAAGLYCGLHTLNLAVNNIQVLLNAGCHTWSRWRVGLKARASSPPTR